MIEIFEDISEQARQRAKFMFEMALRQPTLLETVKVLENYTRNCPTEREQEFVEFYFNMKLEQLKNGNNVDQR